MSTVIPLHLELIEASNIGKQMVLELVKELVLLSNELETFSFQNKRSSSTTTDNTNSSNISSTDSSLTKESLIANNTTLTKLKNGQERCKVIFAELRAILETIALKSPSDAFSTTYLDSQPEKATNTTDSTDDTVYQQLEDENVQLKKQMVSLNQSLFGAIQQTQSTLFNINTLLSEVYKPRELSQPVTVEEMTQRLSLLQTEKQQAQSESNNNESNNGENKTDSSGMNNDNGEGSNNMML